MEVFTKPSVDEALALKGAASACSDELPMELTIEHDQLAEIMNEGGKNAIAKARAVLKAGGVSDKCIEIFSLVCAKAQESSALNIIKDACANLWV